MHGRTRLAVDIGGTFTDVALDSAGRLFTTKVLTTLAAPDLGVLESVAKVLREAGVASGNVDCIVHGTTLATNALIERRGAKTALIVTEGLRDSVEMAQENRFEQYDINVDRPPPLVPRCLRWPIRERMDARGRVLIPLDESSVVRWLSKIREHGIESIAVGLIHSYVNPAHERRVERIIRAAYPDISVSLSCDVCPEIREYERQSTTCANAYVQPLMARYLVKLDAALKDMGFRCPFLLMTSAGGLARLDTATRFPIRLVESGPAGGAILAGRVAAECGLDHVVSCDMGGTTAKLCLIDHFQPLTSRNFEVDRVYRFAKGSGLPIRIPVIEMVEIGAGGGSIVRLDQINRITVGPESSGAAPGPACYGRGGTEPTVTDADILLGRIDPATFAGGEVKLTPDRAQDAIERIGGPLKLSRALAAFSVSEVVDENMANAARVHAIEWGKDLSTRGLIAFGGAAPLHAARLAEKLGIDTIVVPTGAGVGSAIGFLRAPIAYALARSRYQRLSAFDADEMNRTLTEMREEAYAIVRAGAGDAELTETRLAQMRYVGQGHEITVKLPLRDLKMHDAALLMAEFMRTYSALYGRTIPDLDIEVLSLSLSVSSPMEQPQPTPQVTTTYAPPPRATRPVFDAASSDFVEARTYWRTELEPGAKIEGIALISEAQTTTFVPKGFCAVIDNLGYIVMRRADPTAGKATGAALEQLRMQIMWNRLIAVVEEQAQTLLRTAFSPSVREAGDLSAGVFDLRGRMLAQAVTGTPGHVNAMAASIGSFLQEIPLQTMLEGDVYITNDPWKGTGHLHDFTVVTPTFRDGRPAALLACTSHVVDIGGIGMGPDGRQVFEEGLQVPIMPLMERGTINRHLIHIVKGNVREPVQVEGDLYALAACNEVGGRRLIEMMDEYGIDSLDALGNHIVETSRQAMLDEITKLPFGTYRNQMRIDGYGNPVDLVASMTIGETGIKLDFAGTSPQSNLGINVPITYAQAYASFGVRCMVGNRVPNNAGSLEVVKVSAPQGSILNAPRPAAVSARHVIGQMLPDVAFGCLAQAIDGAVPAEGTSCLWNPMVMGGRGLAEVGDYGNATPFSMFMFHCGGTGARPTKDGLSTTAFPSGVRATPVEINENIAPIVIWRKEYRTDSGGAGLHRGGTGQIMEFSHAQGAPFIISAMFDRCIYPARGRNGGRNGELGRVSLSDGTKMNGKGKQTIPPGARLVLEMPGGGGYGDPMQRDPERVAWDVANGIVSPEAACEQYGVVVRQDGGIDAAATTALRVLATHK